MLSAMNNLKLITSIIGGLILGPIIYLYSAEWAILYAGLIAGTISFFLGAKNGSK